MDQDKCESKGCNWLITEDPEDCVITTTTTSTPPTTTSTPGCCKGNSEMSNEKCNAIEDADKCNARSSCEFIDYGVLEEDCIFAPETTVTPGCCYGNPDIAYSARWMESCKAFGTEKECLMLTDTEGMARCFWEPMGDYEDCETVWPTTTSTPTVEAGCCRGDSYKANGKCQMAMEQGKCEDKGCEWLITDDPDDCVITTTTTPTPDTTEEEPGCCYGDTAKTNAMCAEKEGREQCERSGKCEFRPDESDDEPADCSLPTTTSEPWLGAQAEAEDYALPYNPYKQQQQQKSRKSNKNSHRQEQEAMMFGEGNGVVGQAMQYQVSLSSVLLMLVAAFALYHTYAWMTGARKNKDYAAVQSPAMT